MPGHAAGDGMDRVLDVDAPLLELGRELAHGVLRLRDGEPVAGDDHDALAVGEHHGHVLGSGRPDGSARGLDLLRRDLQRAEGAEEDVGDRAAHRPRHHQRQERSRGADEHAAHDQHVLVQDEAGQRRGDAGEGVQERDHDGHVRSADGEHEQGAEGEREDDDQGQHPYVLVAGDDRDPEAGDGADQGQVADTAGRDTGSAGRRSAPGASRTRRGCP